MKASLRSIAALVAVTLAVLSSAQIIPIEEEGPRAPDVDPPSKQTPIKMPPVEMKDYVLVGADNFSNAYTGDTSTAEANSLLCIYAQGLPKPYGLPEPVTTPGGALKNSWSGGKLFIVPKVQGTYLASEAIADSLCAKYGEQNFNQHGARMAEHHDGDNTAGWAGWGFWAEALKLPQHGTHTYDGRLWVKINGQPANPWDNGGGVRMAYTWVKKLELTL